MKRFKIALLVYALFDLLIGGYCGGMLPLSTTAGAQYLPAAPPSGISRGLGVFYASNYAFGLSPGSTPGRVLTGNSATGSQTITLQQGLVALPDGRQDMPYFVGEQILIGNGTNAETVTLTAVSGCIEAPILSGSQGFNCNITASFSNLHGQGEIVQSGTYGLQEAVNDAQSTGGGVAVIDQFWAGQYGSPLRGTNAIIASVLVYPNVVLLDNRGPQPQYWAGRPTGTTAVSGPSAPTFTFASGASSYYCAEAYVDAYGQLSAWVEESSQTTSAAFPATASVPAAATGAVGVAVGCTAASGSSKGETMYQLVSTNCTLTTIETIIPACAISNTTYGQNATASITLAAAPPTTTAKLNGIATGDTANNTRTTIVYQPVSNAATFPFANVLGSLAASSSGNTGTYEVATLNLPLAFFNYVGKKYQLCLDWEATPASTATVTWNLYYGPYNNSDTKIAAISAVGNGFTGSGAHTQNQTCFNLTTITTGATGSILSSGFTMQASASSALGTLLVADASTSSPIVGSLPLSTQQQIRIEAVVGTANLGTAITIDGLALVPLD